MAEETADRQQGEAFPNGRPAHGHLLFGGRGVGRAVMTLAEAEVRARDGRELGLNVFGDNVAARRLYESLGYVDVSVRMHKPL